MSRDRQKKRDQETDKAAGRTVQRLPTSHPQFLDDLQFWIETHPPTAARLIRLVKETLRDPFRGIGKPEPLRGEQGVWSRRLTDEHRFTYRLVGDDVHLLQARFHYGR